MPVVAHKLNNAHGRNYSEELLSSLSAFTTGENEYEGGVRDLLRSFCVLETAGKIAAAGYTRVALQFPDRHLAYAPIISAALAHLLGRGCCVFVLADTAYGACCPDEVGAQHLDADAVVLYGTSCLSLTRTLPVLHVFPARASCIEDGVAQTWLACIDDLVQKHSKPALCRVVVMYDIALANKMQKAAPLLRANHGALVEVAVPRFTNFSQFIDPMTKEGSRYDTDADGAAICGALQFSGDKPLSDTVILWVSEGESPCSVSVPSLRNAVLTLAYGLTGSCMAMYSVGGVSPTARAEDGWRLLRSRARELSRVQSAERIGVVAGTLSVSGANMAIDRLVELIEASGKRAYVLLIGKVTPPKLLNFEEMDAFVFVSCPYRAVLDSKEFGKAIVTPYELVAALDDKQEFFEQAYQTDLGHVFANETDIDNDGKEEKAVAKRGNWELAVGGSQSAAHFHKGRWRGLQADKGGTNDEEDVAQLSTEIIQGISGIALGYKNL